MGDHQVIEFAALDSADLIVDATYRGGSAGNAGDDPLNVLLGCGNQGGFRTVRSADGLRHAFVCLYSSLTDLDWPDHLDMQTGAFTYYGDNKRPGHLLHDSPRGGNKLLQQCFAALHGERENRVAIPPFFIFTKGSRGRDVVFRGVAVPG